MRGIGRSGDTGPMKWRLGQMVGGLCLAVVAVIAPWVTYQINPGRHVFALHADSFAPPLIAFGIVAAVCGGLGLTERAARGAAMISAIVGFAALPVIVVAAATRMSHANHLTLLPGGTTAYGPGAAAALLAAALIAVSASLQLQVK